MGQECKADSLQLTGTMDKEAEVMISGLACNPETDVVYLWNRSDSYIYIYRHSKNIQNIH